MQVVSSCCLSRRWKHDQPVQSLKKHTCPWVWTMHQNAWHSKPRSSPEDKPDSYSTINYIIICGQYLLWEDEQKMDRYHSCHYKSHSEGHGTDSNCGETDVLFPRRPHRGNNCRWAEGHTVVLGPKRVVSSLYDDRQRIEHDQGIAAEQVGKPWMFRTQAAQCYW